MEDKDFNDFKLEVLTQLAVINNKLDNWNDVKKTVDATDKRSRQNEQEIKEAQKDIADIKDSNKWAFRTSIGAIITSAVGIIFLFIKIGMGVS